MEASGAYKWVEGIEPGAATAPADAGRPWTTAEMLAEIEQQLRTFEQAGGEIERIDGTTAWSAGPGRNGKTAVRIPARIEPGGTREATARVLAASTEMTTLARLWNKGPPAGRSLGKPEDDRLLAGYVAGIAGARAEQEALTGSPERPEPAEAYYIDLEYFSDEMAAKGKGRISEDDVIAAADLERAKSGGRTAAADRGGPAGRTSGRPATRKDDSMATTADSVAEAADTSENPYQIAGPEDYLRDLKNAGPPGIDESASVDPTAKVHPTAKVGPGCELGPGVEVGPHALLEADVKVGQHTQIRAGVAIGRGTRVGEHSILAGDATIGRDCVIGSHVSIHSDARNGNDTYVRDDVQIDDHAAIGEAVAISRGVRVGPHTRVVGDSLLEEGARIGPHTTVGYSTRMGAHVRVGQRSELAFGTSVGARAELGENVATGQHARVKARTIVPSHTRLPAAAELDGPETRDLELIRKNAPTGVDPTATVHPDAEVSPLAKVRPGAVIEAGCSVAAGAYVGENAKLGAGSRMEEDAAIGNHAQTGPDCHLGRNTRLGEHAVLRAHVTLEGGEARSNGKPQAARVGHGTVVFGECTIGTGTSVGHDSVIRKKSLLRNCWMENECEIGPQNLLDGDGMRLGTGCRTGTNVRMTGHASVRAGTTLEDGVRITGSAPVRECSTVPAGTVLAVESIPPDLGDTTEIDRALGITPAERAEADARDSGTPERSPSRTQVEMEAHRGTTLQQDAGEGAAERDGRAAAAAQTRTAERTGPTRE